MFHFSTLERGFFRQRAELRLRNRQPFPMTQSVAVARIADKYRSAYRTGSEWINGEPPEAATDVMPRTTLAQLMPTAKRQMP